VVTTTTYTYEGIQLQTLSSSTGTQTTDITYLYDENGKVMALSISTGSPSVVYTLPVRVSDRGDIIAISDYDWNPIVSYTYGAYGSPVATQVGSSASVPLAVAQTIADLQPLRYAGYAYDSFSGLYYCSQRYYDPATMQFLSRDPALSDAEESAYQYCGGEPVGGADPSGLMYLRFTGRQLYMYRYLGQVHGRAKYALKGVFRALTGDPSVSTSSPHGPLPQGTWYFLRREWYLRLPWQTKNASYAPAWGWYVRIHAGSSQTSRSGFYLHSYSKTFAHTWGCIRVDPSSINRIRAESNYDGDGKVQIYVSYSAAFLRNR
jgi:RHS repeat-associated protein